MPLDGSQDVKLHDATKPYGVGDNVGLGFDLNSGDLMNTVVQGTLSTPVGAGGAITSFEVARILTTSDLETQLGVDAEASYGLASFGAGISARFSFSKRMKVQTSSLFMAVRAQVSLPTQSLDNVSLIPDTSALLVGNADQFAAHYGNMFIRNLIRGGLFVGVLRVDTSTTDQSNEIAGQLSGSYGLFSADVETKFQQVSQNFQASIFIDEYSEGGPINLAIDNPGDPLQLIANVKAFLQSFQNSPDAVAVPYTVSLAPISLANGPLPPNAADVQHAQDVIMECVKRRSATMDSLNLLQFIVDNPARFDFTNSVPLDKIQAAVSGFQNDLDLIARCASAAMNNSENTLMPPDFATKNGITTYPTLLPGPLPVRAVAAPSPSGAGAAWTVSAVDTAGAAFPPGGFISVNGIAVDSQGRMTVLAVGGHQTTVIAGAAFAPGGFMNQLTELSNTSDGVMAIDASGRLTMVWSLRNQPLSQVTVVGAGSFPPGGHITRPFANLSLAVDHNGTVQGIYVTMADPPQVQIFPAVGGALPPGTRLTMAMEGPVGTLSSLAIDGSGALVEITAPELQPGAPTVTAVAGANAVFPPGGYISEISQFDVHVAFAVDQQGRLCAIWRLPGQTWTVTPLSGAGAHAPGGVVTDLHFFSYHVPGVAVARSSASQTAFGIDAQGRLTAISLKAKTTLDPATQTPITGAAFPPGGHLTKLSTQYDTATGFGVDAQGRMVKFAFNGQSQQWELGILSGAMFPPGCALGDPYGAGPALVVDNHGRVNSVHFG